LHCNQRSGAVASLTIRNIPDDVKRQFHQRAAANGRSMEEEGRRLIIAAVEAPRRPRKSIGQMLYEGSRPGVDLQIPPRSRARTPAFEAE
jgi:plasmid stability protein